MSDFFLSAEAAVINLWVPGKGDALQKAAYSGSESIVTLLLAHGADVKAPEGYYGSCVECAIAAKNPALARFLLEKGANVNFSGSLDKLNKSRRIGFRGPLSASIVHRQADLTRLLIERGANVNWPCGEYHGTPLENAIRVDNEYAVKLLLENGALVNQVSGCPWFCSCLCNSAEPKERDTRQVHEAAAGCWRRR